MQQLIKITSVPMRTVRYTQNARLVSSDSVDLERRKALARQMSFHRSAGKGSMPMKDITKINRTFSKRTAAAPQGQNISHHQAAFHQTQSKVPPSSAQTAPSTANTAASAMTAAPDFTTTNTAYTEVAAAITATTVSTGSGTSVNFGSSYAVERGSLEMKVAKGDLTFLPPMVMTIVTQYPELHFEYLGDFNYVPPRDPQVGGNLNLAT